MNNVDITNLSNDSLIALMTYKEMNPEYNELFEVADHIANETRKTMCIVHNIHRETGKAYHVEATIFQTKGSLTAIKDDFWFPKSQTDMITDIEQSETYCVIPKWLAFKKIDEFYM